MSRGLTEGVAALSGHPVGRLPPPLQLGRRDPDCSGSEAGREYSDANLNVETAPCCLGDNCPSSAQTAPVGSRQLRLARHSVECGLVGCSRVWWNDRQNDQLSKR
jgi:hypothetical protein